jgi:hypothetical protein
MRFANICDDTYPWLNQSAVTLDIPLLLHAVFQHDRLVRCFDLLLVVGGEPGVVTVFERFKGPPPLSQN